MAIEDNTFPQSGDPDDAVRFAQLIGHGNLTNYVESGLEVTPDFAGGTVSVSAGVCYIGVSSGVATSDSQEISGLGYAIQLGSNSVSLSSGENHLAVVPTYSTNDTNSVKSYTTLGDVPDDALRIAVVDAASETVTLYNRAPTAEFESVTVQDGVRVNDGTDLLATEDWVSSSIASAIYSDTDAVSAIDGEISVAASTVSGLDSAVDSNDSDISSNDSDISSLQSNKLDVSNYTPVVDVDGEISAASGSISGLDSAVSSNDSEISALQSNKFDAADYTPITDVDGEISLAATSVSGLDSAVDSNDSEISALQSNKFDAANYTPESDTHSRYTDSEATSAVTSSVDVSSLLGGNGTADQIIATDGTSLRYTTVDALRTDPPVDSVFGRTGSVTTSSGDYTHSQIAGISSDDHHTKYTDSEALSTVESKISAAALTVSGLDSAVDSNSADISSLQSNKLDASNYNPEIDTHSKYTDSEAISAVDGEVSAAASNVSGLDTAVSNNDSDISALQSNKFDAANYTPESDTHTRYSDSEALSAIESEISAAALTVSGLDSAVNTNASNISSNDSDISSLQSNKFDASNYNPESDTHSRYTDSEARNAVDDNAISPSDVIIGSRVDLPQATAGDSAQSATSIAYDPNEEMLLVAREV